MSTKRSAEALQQRKEATKDFVKQMFIDGKNAEKQDKLGFNDVVTDDEGLDEEGEYTAWKEREFSRIRLLRIASGEEEKDEEDLAAVQVQPAEKGKRAFRQKYWHKGAFFQAATDNPLVDDKVDEIYNRDFSAATGEDKEYDKELLPKVMQVAAGKWGRSGQSKYTHLKDQDTTDRDSPFFKQSRKMRDKYVSKMGGMGGTGGGFEKPSNKKR